MPLLPRYEALFRQALWLLFFLLGLMALPAWGADAGDGLDNATCLECHADQAAEKSQKSVHGQLDCVGCHADIKESPHDTPLRPVDCGACHSSEQIKFKQSTHGQQPMVTCKDCHGTHEILKATNVLSGLYWQNIPRTCGRCHENIQQTYLRSVHGKATQDGKRDAPVCTDCHGEHSIEAVKLVTSKVSGAHIPETCGQCHAAERIVTKYGMASHVLDTYMGSFHGLAQQLGSMTAANCASCHGAHDILPSNDPRSSVHPENLPVTCGRCHAGVSAKVAKGQIHSGPRPGLEHRATLWVRRFYLVLIILVIGGMLLHNGVDFLKKLWAHHRRMEMLREQPRMTASQRIQHAFLIVAFVSLAYTGFALKYPHSWWASPFMGRMEWRGFGHRFAAMVFCALGLYHACFILFTRRGRKELIAIWPTLVDARQCFEMILYYLGRRKEKPVFGRYSYIEKAEYWALVWGSVVMALTGALMTWNNWTMGYFPKWFFDVITAIHFYEAILACLAIVIWHGYFTVFDPDEYPMKLTWITGENSLADRMHRKPKEDEKDDYDDGHK